MSAHSGWIATLRLGRMAFYGLSRRTKRLDLFYTTIQNQYVLCFAHSLKFLVVIRWVYPCVLTEDCVALSYVRFTSTWLVSNLRDDSRPKSAQVEWNSGDGRTRIGCVVKNHQLFPVKIRGFPRVRWCAFAFQQPCAYACCVYACGFPSRCRSNVMTPRNPHSDRVRRGVNAGGEKWLHGEKCSRRVSIIRTWRDTYTAQHTARTRCNRNV